MRSYSAVDAAIQLSPTEKSMFHTRSAPVTGCATAAVAVNTKSATTTMRAMAGDNGRLAGAVTQQHEESDAGACPEQNRLSCLADNRQTSSLVAGTGSMQLPLAENPPMDSRWQRPTPILPSVAIPPVSWRDCQTGDALRFAHLAHALGTSSWTCKPWRPATRRACVEADNQELAT